MESPTLTDPPLVPLPLFRAWHDEATACEGIQYAGAMCLSTLSPDGFPEGRIVLLHEVDEAGFAFFTDRRSPKGRSLAQTPRAALTFYWGPLERQVRVRGSVEVASDETADRFFRERPRRSKGTAWASPQSQLLDRKETLAQRMATYDEEFADRDDIPRPPYWTAYRLLPLAVEFWQAKARRLHERLRYTRSDDGWTLQRLYP